MTIHPSLSSKGKGKGIRSVLKRFERLKELLAKEKWQPGNSVFGLPKIKILRWKAKKAKKDEAELTAEGATGEAAAPKEADKAAPKEGKSDKK
jgi:small basic protein (TIGR04137 family)